MKSGAFYQHGLTLIPGQIYISKQQGMHRWSLGMDNQFYVRLDNGYDNLWIRVIGICAYHINSPYVVRKWTWIYQSYRATHKAMLWGSEVDN